MTEDGLLAGEAIFLASIPSPQSQSFAESEPLLNWERYAYYGAVVSLSCYLMQTAYELLSSRSRKKTATVSLLPPHLRFSHALLSHDISMD